MMNLETGCDPGSFYRFLFNISIGLERLGKLIIVCDFFTDHGEFPLDRDLRRAGHDLVGVFEAVQRIRERRSTVSRFCGSPDNRIHKGMIEVFSDFATGTRYYNLDFLVGSNRIGEKPETSWNTKVAGPLLATHFDQREGQESRMRDFGETLGDFIVVSRHSLRGEAINDPVNALLDEEYTEFVFKSSRKFLIHIVRCFVEALMHLELKDPRFPCFGEILATFYNPDEFLEEFEDW